MNDKIQVIIEEPLVRSMINTIIKGASRRTLKAVCNANGDFYIESKELRIKLNVDSDGKISEINIHNDKLQSNFTRIALEEMKLLDLANKAIKALAANYSPSSNNLADNIIVFGKAYGVE